MLVQKKILRLTKPYTTTRGQVISQPEVAYEEYGLSSGPTVLITHGGLQDMHQAGYYQVNDAAPGPWDELIGEGKAIDTTRYRVVSMNCLGSMFGTSGPASLNPETMEAYGPDFPVLSFEDLAHFAMQFLAQLGVHELALVMGPSLGGCLALQMAALYPNQVRAVVAVASSGRMTPEGMAFHHWIMNMIRTDPAYAGGRYKQRDMQRCLMLIHQNARIYFGHESGLKFATWDRVPEGPEAQQQRSERVADYLADNLLPYLEGRDPNSYITLLTALNSYDLGLGASSYAMGVQRITCPTLLINFSTDSEFPPYWAEELGKILNARTPGQCQVEKMTSLYGHYGCLREAKAMAPKVSAFVSKLK